MERNPIKIYVMKFLVLALLFTCGPALSFANATDPLVTRTQVEDFRLDLQLANLQGQRTLVSLKNLDGGSVYYTRVREHNGYALTLDLSKLPAGRYLLKVKQDEVLRQQVVVKSAAGLYCSDWK